MALGLLLRVSWMCFLLFDGSTGLPTLKGYGYPYKNDPHNIGDDANDEALTSDLSNWQPSNNQPSFPVHTSFSKPSDAQWPGSASAQQNLPNRPSAPEVERLTNGGTRDWGMENPEKPLVFPLSPNYQLSDPAKPQPGPVQPHPAIPQPGPVQPHPAKPQPGPVQPHPAIPQPGPVQPHPAKPQPGPAQPQSTSLSVASANRMPASPAGGSTSPALFSPSQAAQSPGFDSWKPGPVSSGYGVYENPNQDFTSGSSHPHLVYEEVFQYPSENTGPSSSTAGGYSQANYMSGGSASTQGEPSFPRYPTNVGTKPVFPFGLHLGFGKTGFRLRDRISQLRQKAFNAPKAVVPQRVSEPVPPPPPPSYIVQSRNGYQRAIRLLSHSKYSPEFPSPMPVRSQGVKGQPAAPKGVKNPQSTKW
ncbi:uncharacterized protein LOC126405092 [Epinephelus moara]|uniref:uncharacterized protein LOC126405092 n=1 Tax=Epinephelus moara TaxID=300413 RepID=UPI00214EB8E3|nr:uncharacterized protein LOC126405092 [Epinephelus moara]